MGTQETFDSETLCEVAACLWEAVLDLGPWESPGAEGESLMVATLRAYRTRNGTAALRSRICDLSTACETAWRAATEAEAAPLRRELEAAPFRYRLRVVQRWTRHHDEKRRAEYMAAREGVGA